LLSTVCPLHNIRQVRSDAISGGIVMARLIIALVVTLSALIWSDTTEAQKQPNVSDIATCNKEAEAAAGTPSALPRPPAPGQPGISQLPDARGGVPVANEGKMTPSAAPHASALGGTTDSTGQLITRPADPRLEGMAAARAGDAAFREAYRTCMQRLGY
jgi:uncharacterized Zn-binding protein involved in type VI secretion